MNKSPRSKKALSLLVLLAGLVAFWFALIPYREFRAHELATEAEGLHQTDPIKAIAELKEAIFIHSDPGLTNELDRWQLGPEIRQRPTGVQAVLLAKQLAQLKLFDSAEQVLSGGGELNSSGTALLAEIRLEKNEQLDDIRTRLEKAVKADPSDIHLHELLQQTDEKLGNQKAASDEAAKITRLKNGTP